MCCNKSIALKSRSLIPILTYVGIYTSLGSHSTFQSETHNLWNGATIPILKAFCGSWVRLCMEITKQRYWHIEALVVDHNVVDQEYNFCWRASFQPFSVSSSVDSQSSKVPIRGPGCSNLICFCSCLKMHLAPALFLTLNRALMIQKWIQCHLCLCWVHDLHRK